MNNGKLKSKIDEFLTLKKAQGISRGSLEIYGRDLDELLEWAKTHAIDGKAFFLYLVTRGLKPKTTNRKMVIINSLLKSLGIDVDKTLKVKEEKPLPKVLTNEEIKLLLKSIPSLRDKTIISTLVFCGLRVSELCSLNLDDFRNGNELKVKGKGNKERIVYMDQQTAKLLKSYINGRKVNGTDPGLFLSRLKKRFTRSRLWQVIDKYSVKILRKHVNPHVFRHTFATNLLRSGKISVVEVQKLLGHADIKTTLIYTHLTDNDLKRHYLAATKNGGKNAI